MRVQLTLSNSFFLDDVKRTLALAYLFLETDSKGAYLNDKLIQVSLHSYSYLLHKISIKILPRRLSKPFSHFFLCSISRINLWFLQINALWEKMDGIINDKKSH